MVSCKESENLTQAVLLCLVEYAQQIGNRLCAYRDRQKCGLCHLASPRLRLVTPAGKSLITNDQVQRHLSRVHHYLSFPGISCVGLRYLSLGTEIQVPKLSSAQPSMLLQRIATFYAGPLIQILSCKALLHHLS